MTKHSRYVPVGVFRRKRIIQEDYRLTSVREMLNVALQLTREYNIQCCCLYYPVLKQHIQYEYEPCDSDPIDRYANRPCRTIYICI